MASVSGISTVSKIFSKLGDNSGSVVPMFAKDMASCGLTSMVYYKDGGNQDGAEKTLEEFGTGIIWLGGIPFVKKIIDKTIFKKYDINPNIDAKRLFTGKNKQFTDSVEYAAQKAASLGADFEEQAKILTDTVARKDVAKKLSMGKFAVATALTSAALYGLITFKQKRTEKEIEKQIKEKNQKQALLKNSIQETTVYQMFKGNTNTSSPSFKGLGTFIMTNAVANTALVDGVITGTRLAQARKGEKFEVGLKELCELLFIYGLAQPLQKGLEFASDKIFKKPISLDYSVLDSKLIKDAIEAEKDGAGTSELLKQAKELVKISGKNSKDASKNAQAVMDFIFDKNNSKMAEVLKKSGIVSTFKTKEGAEQLSLLSSISADKAKGAAQKTVELIEHAAQKGDVTKYLKQTKVLKGISIVGNIAISALMLGFVQPKLNLFIRKKLNNGDNTNPAIRDLTNQMEQKLAFEGQQSQSCIQA